MASSCYNLRFLVCHSFVSSIAASQLVRSSRFESARVSFSPDQPAAVEESLDDSPSLLLSFTELGSSSLLLLLIELMSSRLEERDKLAPWQPPADGQSPNSMIGSRQVILSLARLYCHKQLLHPQYPLHFLSDSSP